MKVFEEKNEKSTAESVQPYENSDEEAGHKSDVTSNEDKNESSYSADAEIEKPIEVNTVDDQHGANKADEDNNDTQLEANTGNAEAENKPDMKEENANNANLSNLTGDGSRSEEPVKKTTKSWSQKRLKEEWRRFNMDLSPKVLCRIIYNC